MIADKKKYRPVAHQNRQHQDRNDKRLNNSKRNTMKADRKRIRGRQLVKNHRLIRSCLVLTTPSMYAVHAIALTNTSEAYLLHLLLEITTDTTSISLKTYLELPKITYLPSYYWKVVSSKTYSKNLLISKANFACLTLLISKARMFRH